MKNVEEYTKSILEDLANLDMPEDSHVSISIDPAEVNIIALCDKINHSNIGYVKKIQQSNNNVIFHLYKV